MEKVTILIDDKLDEVFLVKLENFLYLLILIITESSLTMKRDAHAS